MKISTTIKTLDLAAFEYHWNGDEIQKLDLLKKSLWRDKSAGTDQEVHLLYINRLCGVKFALFVLNYIDTVSIQASQRLGTDLVKMAINELCQCADSWQLDRAKEIINDIHKHVHSGGNIYDLEDKYLNAVQRISDDFSYGFNDYIDELDYVAYSSLTHLFIGMEGCGIDKDVWRCTEDARHNYEYALTYTDSRIKVAYEMAKLAWDAETQWQKGTNLEFEFCSNKIKKVIEGLDSIIFNDQKEQVENTVAILLDHWIIEIESEVITEE